MAGITQENFDDRGNPKHPISRGPTTIFTTIVSENSKIVDLWANGELVAFIYEAPNLTTDTTFDLTILDRDDVVIFTDTGLADNKATIPEIVAIAVADRKFLFGAHKIKIEFTTAQVATFKVTLLLK